ncbi:hypothetical protein, partial [Escherichia coli]|uniref:hypothetical protein n=1 Tax=Escherichia coli TaxID=562 RepID=UPI001411D7FA
MTPAHHKRRSIPAQRLTGQGYKGHARVNTTRVVFPPHPLSEPTLARSSPRSHSHNMPSAQDKAHPHA